MAQLTTLDELREHIALLARVEETQTPFVSAYLNLENGEIGWQQALMKRSQVLRRVLKNDDLNDFEQVLEEMTTWLKNHRLANAKGAAIFARGNAGGAFMLPMLFAAPLPDWVALYPTPNIYHLVELKDNYHRYVVLFSLPHRASILEVNLGAVTKQAWIANSGARMRVDSEWSRTHFQVNHAHRGTRFLDEKIALLQRLMSAGGQTHLILAGDPRITEQIRRALPDDLAEKLVDVVKAGRRDNQTDVVLTTLERFIKHEEQESRSVAERLIAELRSNDLAVAGSAATLDALRWSDADTLVMAADYQPDPGWSCTHCRAVGTETPETRYCPQCGKSTARPLDVKEALLRLAAQSHCPVEIVERSDVLMSLGGVGCLLRHRQDAYFANNIDTRVQALTSATSD